MLRLRFGKFFASLLCAFCLLISFTSQASAVALTPLNDDTEFVKQVYSDFLNRQPDADGLSYWVNQLEAGTLDRSELVEQYLLSPEFGETVSPVVRLYFTYYQRIPDYDGLMFWVNSYAAGMTLNDVSDAFADAQEFIDRYGSLTNEEFVSKMYINVYDRQPDSEGLSYWTELLDSLALTRGEVMVFFSSAEEYVTISANQVYVTMTYMGLLRRAPDQEGFDFWAGIMDGGASGLALIDDFQISDEYADRFDVNVEVPTGIWTTALTDNDLLAFIFFADGTYVHLEVDEQAPIDVEGEASGMEWGTYTRDSLTGELTVTQTFDGNGDTGLTDFANGAIPLFAQVSGDVLTLEFDDNENGTIDAEESLDFSRSESSDLLGVWTTALTDNDLLAFVFFADGTYVHLEVDEQAPIDVEGEASGMEWGTYTRDSLTGELTVTQTFEGNGDTGLTDFANGAIPLFAQVSGDVLTLEFDDNENGTIDADEFLDFQRQ